MVKGCNITDQVLHIRSDDKRSPWYLGRVCLVASLGGFLFGFDTAVIPGTVGMVEELLCLTP